MIAAASQIDCGLFSSALNGVWLVGQRVVTAGLKLSPNTGPKERPLLSERYHDTGHSHTLKGMVNPPEMPTEEEPIRHVMEHHPDLQQNLGAYCHPSYPTNSI